MPEKKQINLLRFKNEKTKKAYIKISKCIDKNHIEALNKAIARFKGEIPKNKINKSSLENSIQVRGNEEEIKKLKQDLTEIGEKFGFTMNKTAMLLLLLYCYDNGFDDCFGCD